MTVKLHVLLQVPNDAPKEFELAFNQDTITIGRDKDNDLQLPLSTVSRHHAKFYLEDSDWFIQDLHSTHGTLWNGQILGAGGNRLVRDGDVIEIVHSKITFQIVEGRLAESTSEDTSIVARKMVQNAFSNLGDNTDIPYIRIMNGPLEGKKIDIGPHVTELVFGRGEECEIQINDVNVSRRHALFRREWDEISVEDLHSKNGVFVNGTRITGPTKLHDADEVELGAFRLVFVDPTARILSKLSNVPAFLPETKKAAEQEKKSTQTNVADAPIVQTSEKAKPVSPATQAAPIAPALSSTIKQASVPITKKKTDITEYILIGLAALVVIGLIVGAILLMD